MAKYKRAVIVDAFQWNAGDVVAGVTPFGLRLAFVMDGPRRLNLKAGDWIVTENGRRFIVDDDAFKRDYEVAS